jgi:monooxygenase
MMKSMLRKAAVKQLAEGDAVDTHFAPSYNPWDQRMCLVPDGHRPEPVGHRGHAAGSRRTRSGRVKDGVLQGNDALGRAELRLDDRLHKRVVDAEGRPGGRVRVPAAQAHGRERLCGGDARRGRRDGGQSVPGPGIGIRQAQPRGTAQAGRSSVWHQNNVKDVRLLRQGPIDDAVVFTPVVAVADERARNIA